MASTRRHVAHQKFSSRYPRKSWLAPQSRFNNSEWGKQPKWMRAVALAPPGVPPRSPVDQGHLTGPPAAASTRQPGTPPAEAVRRRAAIDIVEGGRSGGTAPTVATLQADCHGVGGVTGDAFRGCGERARTGAGAAAAPRRRVGCAASCTPPTDGRGQPRRPKGRGASRPVRVPYPRPWPVVPGGHRGRWPLEPVSPSTADRKKTAMIPFTRTAA
jgi:hypothetical protein